MTVHEKTELFGSIELVRPVCAVGIDLVTEGYEQPPHTHPHAQLILALRGLITCDVAKGLWMVPPHCALWIPGDLQHSVHGEGALELYILCVSHTLAPQLPKECCTVSVTALFRELIIASSMLPRLYDEAGPPGRLIQAMLDELIAAPTERLHLPMPTDPRLKRVADAFAAGQSDRVTIAEWARRVAVSQRTLCRLIREQTGMSFGRWRQQFHIMRALERLAAGETVSSVADELGYESASAFISMFKKALGQPPARYLSTRKS